ncbi:hypothetical protein D3C84_704710 [compost metagenome]
MFDQRSEFFGVGVGQFLNGAVGEHVATEPPLQRELPAIDLAFQRQPVGQRCIVTLGLTAAFRCGYKQCVFIELAVELAEVVEGDPWRR